MPPASAPAAGPASAPASAPAAPGPDGAAGAPVPAVPPVPDTADEVYEELRRIATRWFRGQRPDHTLQPTALIHEAWMRLARTAPGRYRDRHHFLATAATAMKQILINHARDRGAQRRGGGRERVHLDRADGGEAMDPDVLMDLAEALDQLERVDPRKATIAELRLLGGMTMPQIAARLGVSLTTTEDHWRTTRAWLSARMAGWREESS